MFFLGCCDLDTKACGIALGACEPSGGRSMLGKESFLEGRSEDLVSMGADVGDFIEVSLGCDKSNWK